MAEGATMIQVENLAKSYGPHQALKGISFRMSSGEVLGFLGPNGAGKTTTMKILTCYMAPTAGRATVAGEDVIERSLEVRRNVGYLPEDTPLYPDMTTLDFLEYAAVLRQVPAERQLSRIRDISAVCGLLEVMGKQIGELSKGYRQRVGLAQAMVHDPPILILDEPTSGLDPNQIVEIRELIKEIGKQKTVILSTHILPEVQATCGRVIIISDGKIVADGATDELARGGGEAGYTVVVEPDGNREERAPEETLCERLGTMPSVAGVTELDRPEEALRLRIAAEAGQDLRRDIFRCVRDSGWLLLEMQQRRLSLEDVFRKLTREA
jgi:ABC-2 type transport system ATP-binding protein